MKHFLGIVLNPAFKKLTEALCHRVMVILISTLNFPLEIAPKHGINVNFTSTNFSHSREIVQFDKLFTSSRVKLNACGIVLNNVVAFR